MQIEWIDSTSQVRIILFLFKIRNPQSAISLDPQSLLIHFLEICLDESQAFWLMLDYIRQLPRWTERFTLCEHNNVHVITRRVLKEFAALHKAAERPLDSWYAVAKKALWQRIADVRASYPHADAVGRCTVFNIGGNKYRLIVKIEYQLQTIFIRQVLTHAEYEKEAWKHDC